MPARQKQLETSVRHQAGGAVIELRGEIDISSEHVLNDAYAQAESKDPDIILINFADVSYINSAGIALILGLLAKARLAKRRIVACGLSDHYVEIFTITRLSDFITLFPDEASALADTAKR